MDSTEIRAVLSLLTQEVGHSLSLWTDSQQELGATGLPVDDPIWPAGIAQSATLSSPQIQPPPAIDRTDESSGKRANESSDKPTKTPIASTLHAFHTLCHQDSSKTQDLQTPQERTTALVLFNARLAACRKCVLGAQTRGVIVGRGTVDATIMFVGAGANPAELNSQRFMCGQAADLLDKIVDAMGDLSPMAGKEHIFATNIIKCACHAPISQRSEISRTCLGHLREEVNLVRPRVIIVWGEFAYHAMFGGNETMSQVRGQWKKFEGFQTLATHHPLEMIKNARLKQRVWQDLKLAVQTLTS